MRAAYCIIESFRYLEETVFRVMETLFRGIRMKTFTERDFITYPRRFKAYKWYKPILTGLLLFVFLFITNMAVQSITKAVFHTTVINTGYDDIDFYSAAGAFKNCAMIACYIPSIILAALIVRDRPVSSYWSSMGGWRWKVFFRALGAGFVIFGIPNTVVLLLMGNSGVIRLSPGGLLMLILFLPLQCIAEELLYRSYIMQTAGSWFKVSVIGLIVQIMVFTAAHNYNIAGRVSIALTALVYGVICVITKGIEVSSAFHFVNNAVTIFLTGMGFGSITADQSAFSTAFNLVLMILLLLFIIYADRKLHWFDEVKKDDVTAFNEKGR